MSLPLPDKPQFVSFSQLAGRFAEYFATATDVDNWLQQRITYIRFQQTQGQNHAAEIKKIEDWWKSNRTGPI